MAVAPRDRMRHVKKATALAMILASCGGIVAEADDGERNSAPITTTSATGWTCRRTSNIEGCEPVISLQCTRSKDAELSPETCRRLCGQIKCSSPTCAVQPYGDAVAVTCLFQP
jgi:hypothetical protein